MPHCNCECAEGSQEPAKSANNHAVDKYTNVDVFLHVQMCVCVCEC